MEHVRRRIDIMILAVMAYLPALCSSPGRMPADTKLYLSLDPARQLADSLNSWDARQFAGLVPHQTVGYLWPSGPWFWSFEALGVPDWIAHRLWIGTILFCAGLGIRWVAGQFGLAPIAAFAAAVVYQNSPYVLPYIGRTSALLLPWAALGWLLGLTDRAARRGGWRHPALFVLLILTVGGINATAIVMIAPLPVMWLMDAALRREVTWRRAFATAARIGGGCFLISLWWLVPLAVQGRYGADALAYSESLESVAHTATAPEALRGLGYWLFYVIDHGVPLTSAARPHQESVAVLASGWLLILIGLSGLALARWRIRRVGAAALLLSVLMAVGVHPINDPSPLTSPVAASSRAGWALAFRSSTRALPIALLVLALGCGAAVGFFVQRVDRRRVRAFGVAGFVGVVAINNPTALATAYVDPALDRSQEPPTGWLDAAEAFDQREAGYRVMQLGGAESGVFRWGTTVDPVLPGLTERPMIQRDWLPLGSPAAMDLFYAFDASFQNGVAEPAAVAPLARLFGADVVVVNGDSAFERFRTPRPSRLLDVLRGAPAMVAEQRFGAETANVGAPVVLDGQALADGATNAPVATMTAFQVAEPEPITTVRTSERLIVGSGQGIVDAAAAGLLDGRELLRSLAAGDPQNVGRNPDAAVIVTDSNRAQAHHWRGSQAVLGMTESAVHPANPDDTADHRFPVFPDQQTDQQTFAEQRTGFTATATSYGEPFGYLPERRAVMAVDGDPSTAWTTAEGAIAVNEAITLTLPADSPPISSLNLTQPSGDRMITQVSVSAAGTTTMHTLSGLRETVPVSASAGDAITITVLTTSPGRNGVGFSEIMAAGIAPTGEVVTVPSASRQILDGTSPAAVVLTRWRADPTDRHRSDPEPVLHRSFATAAPLTLAPQVSVRLDRRASDTVLASILGTTGEAELATATDRLAGYPSTAGWAAADGDETTAWLTAFDRSVGAALTLHRGSGPFDQLTIRQRVDERHSQLAAIEVESDGTSRQLVLDPDLVEQTVGFEALGGSTITVRIAAIRERRTKDLRTQAQTVLPVAISSIDGPGLRHGQLPARIDTGCRSDLLLIDDRPVPLRIATDTAALFRGDAITASLCGVANDLRLGAGEHTVLSAAGSLSGLGVDRVVLATTDFPLPVSAAAPTAPDRADLRVTSRGRSSRTALTTCPGGCWFVLGEGYSDGWRAKANGVELGAPTLVNGAMAGWYLGPAVEPYRVEVSWPPQRIMWLGIALSAVTALAALSLVLRTRRYTVVLGAAPVLCLPGLAADQSADVGRRSGICLTAGAFVALTVSPLAGLAVAAIGLAGTALRRWWLVSMTGVALIASAAVRYGGTATLDRVSVGFDFPISFEWHHRPTLVGLALIALGCVFGAGQDPTDPTWSPKSSTPE